MLSMIVAEERYDGCTRSIQCNIISREVVAEENGMLMFLPNIER